MKHADKSHTGPGYSMDGISLITPVKLDPCKKGDFEVSVETIKAGTETVVVSMRNAIYAGLKPCKARFDRDLRVHRLLYKGDTVTSDCPQELYTQGVITRHAHGHVLVGGLGISMAALMLARMPQVESVTIVELEKDVIDLIGNRAYSRTVGYKDAPIQVIHADLFDYLKKSKLPSVWGKRLKAFDFAYYDIWGPTGESAWKDYIVPLRRLSLKRFPKMPVGCWLEEEMIGQLRTSLQLQVGVELTADQSQLIEIMNKANAKIMGVSTAEAQKRRVQAIRYWQPASVFYDAIQGEKAVGRTLNLDKLMHLYLREVGTPAWEAVFGKLWDSWKKPVR